MSDSSGKAFKEAEAWLVSAKHTLVDSQSDEALASVCCAQAIHGIIRANDALMLKFYGTKPTRHDNVPLGFAKLVREGKLLTEDEHFKAVLFRAMRDKSGADYGKGQFTYDDSAWYVESGGVCCGRQ